MISTTRRASPEDGAAQGTILRPNVPTTMIDLHCHVLPGIDDGPDTLDAALALARAADQAGTRTVVATPHVSWRYQNDAATIDKLVTDLQAHLRTAGVEIDIRPGAEIAATKATELDEEELVRLAIGNGPWLLLEPPFSAVAAGFDGIALDLMRRGHRIVIAHPERCPAFRRDASMLSALVRAGALTSITAASLTGRFGQQVRRFAMALVADGMVHNAASDAHDDLSRPPGIASHLEQAGLGEMQEWLTELVPAAILAGEPIPSQPRLTRSPLKRRRSVMARLMGR